MGVKTKTREVLFDLCDDVFSVSEAIFTVIYHPSACMKYGYEDYLGIRRAISRREKREALRSLEQHRLIKIEKKAKQASILLTQKGKLELLKERIARCQTPRSDGRLCLISFDIPEHVRTVRMQLCRFLKSADFVKLHRSVWYSKMDVADSLKLFVKKSRLQGWVRVYLAEKV